MTQRRITSRDIAREAGVSQPTVSRALRGDPRVAAATAALVAQTAHRLGYVPNAAARSLITSRSGTIAVVIADITNPFYPELLEGLHAELARSGYRSVLLNERTDTRDEGGFAALVRGRVVDGAIVATATNEDTTRRVLDAVPGPVVQIVREVDGVVRDSYVADNRGGAKLAGELLVRHGHERIGFIGGPPDTSTAREREAGLRDALKAARRDLDPRLVRAGDYTHQVGYQACLELLDAAVPPTAIFAANDVLALGALDAARRRGIDVPGELSVIGFDDISLASWESFRLTTVRQPLARMTHEAARALITRIERTPSAPPQKVEFRTELIERATTAPVRVR